MKHFAWTTLSLLLMMACACSSDKTRIESAIEIGDTVTTASGLKYVYTRKGDGRPVQTGSRVYTYLTLNVNGKEVWNTNDQPDSAFVFIANKDRMIKGFTEVTMILREGDQIVAILPPALAYGEKGSGDVIPPNATLVYSQYKMLKVDLPKLSLSDTLFQAYKFGGHKSMLSKREQILNSSDTSGYYYGNREWRILWNLLNEAGMHKEALEMIAYSNTNKEGWPRYYRVRSYDQLGMYQVAIDSLNKLMATDTSYTKDDRALSLLGELNEKLRGTKK